MPKAIARSLEWAATAKPWVDPYVVRQEKLRAARRLKKLQTEKEQEKSKSTNLASNDEE